MSFLKVEDVKIHFPIGKGKVVKAVDGVSFELKKGGILGIVGESGCGKSTLARGIMRLNQVREGKISLLGRDILAMEGSELLEFRRHLQMVFQDPEASLNPRFTCGEIIAEPIRVFEPHLKKDEVATRVQQLMLEVGLNPNLIRRFPHEFSGGQRQRISIARSISINPVLLVCDEAVSALDVSIQAQIINLLNALKKEHQLTYLFISHDLSVVRYISDEIMVMYLGKVVEKGPSLGIINQPKHPYTEALISAVPEYQRKKAVIDLEGEIPSPINPPSGCAFSTRCPKVKDHCRRERPPLERREDGRWVACFEV